MASITLFNLILFVIVLNSTKAQSSVEYESNEKEENALKVCKQLRSQYFFKI
jgi:cytochrome c-type biogenesis protein CcmH/NrfF